MLSSMHNDLIGEFEDYLNAQEMWNQLKIAMEGFQQLGCELLL